MTLLSHKLDLHQTPSTRELFTFGLLLLIIFVGFLMGVLPTQKQAKKGVKAELASIQEQHAAIKKLLSTVEHEIEQRKEVRTEKKQQVLDRRLERVLGQKPGIQSEEIASVVSLLSTRRMLARASLKEVTVGQATENKGYSMTPITIKLEGRYIAISQYLEKLENFEWPILVHSIDIDSSEGGFLVANLDVGLYLPN